MHVHCVYVRPSIGDVPLLSAVWRDADHGQMLHVAVPVVDAEPWWHWMHAAPVEVQSALRHVWASMEEDER